MSDFDRERTPDPDLEMELDRAIDALNDERQPETPSSNPDGYWEALEVAMLVRSLQPPADAEAEFPGKLASRLAGTLAVRSPNGHASFATVAHVPDRSRPPLRSALMPAIQTTGAYAIAGMAAGVVVGGIGARIAMRVSAEMYAREHPNFIILTESSGNRVGEFTWSGTFDLLGEAMAFGLVGGLFYLVARRWLPKSSRLTGLIFGMLLLLLAGAMILSADNRDFTRLGSPVVNVAMFGSLFVLFGLAVAPLSRWIGRFAIVRKGRWSAIGRWSLGLIGVVGMLAILAMVAIGLFLLADASRRAVDGGVGLTEAAAITTVVAVLVVLPLCRAILAAIDSGIFPPGHAFRAAFDLVGRLALAVAVVLGSTITLAQVGRILDLF